MRYQFRSGKNGRKFLIDTETNTVVNRVDYRQNKFFGYVGKLKKIKNKLKNVSGGTFDENGDAVEHKKGVQVTFYRPHVNKISERLHDKILNRICKKYKTRPDFGVWKDDNGETQAELSFCVLTQKEADRLMLMFNQDATMDWEKKQKYPNNPQKWFKAIVEVGVGENERKEPDYEKIYKKI